jgi:hypothetical protein
VRHSYSLTKAWASRRGGLAPRFLSLHPGCCGRTRAGTHWVRCWGDEYLQSEDASAPVYFRSVPLQCCASQVGHRALGGLRPLQPSSSATSSVSALPSRRPGFCPPQQRAQDVPSDVEGHSGLHYRVGHRSRAGLQDLQQPEDQIIEWQRAWDEVADVHWESDVEQSDPDTATQQKRPSA